MLLTSDGGVAHCIVPYFPQVVVLGTALCHTYLRWWCLALHNAILPSEWLRWWCQSVHYAYLPSDGGAVHCDMSYFPQMVLLGTALCHTSFRWCCWAQWVEAWSCSTTWATTYRDGGRMWPRWSASHLLGTTGPVLPRIGR